MKMNATSNAANPRNSRKRNRNGVRPPIRAEEPKGGGPTPGGSGVNGNRGGRRSSAPPTGGSGAPNPTPKGEPCVRNSQPPLTPALVALTRAARTPRSAA